MKCPYCSKEMIEGIIQGASEVFFSIKERKFFFVAQKGDVVIQDNFSNPKGKSYPCPNCKKVIFDYSDKNDYH